ncbi:MAG: type II toxin-antitoxin system Phd/YefM family antitoxin [Chloroflexi bacterium]|nr:type II toxin-antitoxin system Phd/YefM family antitoxin [Chloroflexota bacterium]
MESITISKFKATCLAVLESVRKTGQPILVTKRGEPIAEIVPASRPARGKRRLGTFADSGKVVGDIITPVAREGDWEILRE